MKNIIKIFILSLILSSCGDFEPVIYDNVNGQTLLKFTTGSTNLPVTINEMGEIQIEVSSSTTSDVDRSFNLVVDPSSTAAPENYNVPASVVIPANSYTGTFTVTCTDVSVETDATTIVVGIDTSDDSIVNGTHTVSMFQVCPVPSTFFTGMYLIEQTSAQVDGYSLSHNSIVEVVAIDETTRSFATEAYITYCSGTFFNFQINLVCNELIVPFQDTTCRCSSVTDWWGPATTPETYDVSDDSVIFLTFTDDAQSDCGNPAQTTYKFTKQ